MSKKEQEERVDETREDASLYVRKYIEAVIDRYVVDDWERREALSALQWLALDHSDDK